MMFMAYPHTSTAQMGNWNVVFFPGLQSNGADMWENIKAILQLTAILASGVFIIFGLPWVFAIGCVALGHGPEVCGL